jgi:hypothetical protein
MWMPRKKTQDGDEASKPISAVGCCPEEEQEEVAGSSTMVEEIQPGKKTSS